jgi:hypothetical protein
MYKFLLYFKCVATLLFVFRFAIFFFWKFRIILFGLLKMALKEELNKEPQKDAKVEVLEYALLFCRAEYN